METVLRENLATCTNEILQSLVELGEELREANEYKKALSCFDEVLLLDGENIAALDKRNFVLAQMGGDSNIQLRGNLTKKKPLFKSFSLSELQHAWCKYSGEVPCYNEFTSF